MRWCIDFARNLVYTLFNTIRALYLSKLSLGTRILNIPHQKNCIILGNGPSCQQSINEILEKGLHKKYDLFCVNFFAQSKEFFELKPSFYIFADQLFWSNNLDRKAQKKCNNLINILERVDWELKIFLPYIARNKAQIVKSLEVNNHIEFVYYNNAPFFTGFRSLRFFFYNRNFSFISGNNVLIVALYLAVLMKYEEVYLVGADHSWMENYKLGNDGIWFRHDLHSYDPEKSDENKILALDPKGIPFKITYILENFAQPFYKYYLLEDYAKSRNVKIYNASIHTWLDAFRRKDF